MKVVLLAMTLVALSTLVSSKSVFPRSKRALLLKREDEGVLEAVKRHRSRDCTPGADAPECLAWKDMGLCGNDLYNIHCANACGFCGDHKEVKLEERHRSRDCTPGADAGECLTWKDMGLCGNDLYNVHCANTCGFCGDHKEVKLEERHRSRDCTPGADAGECLAWKDMGLCGNDLYNVHCANTCGFCGDQLVVLEKRVEIELELEE